MLRNFERDSGVLLIGGLPVNQIVAETGTPVYIYDAATVERRYAEVREAFPSFEILYSMKANPSFALVGLLKQLGAGAEIASGGELHLAGEVGFDPLDVVFAGPGKSDRELEEAIVAGLFAINVESFRELARIVRISKLVRVPARVALRINTSAGLSRAGVGSAGPLHEQMAGGPSKFGIDEEKLETLSRFLGEPGIDVVGIHIYTASQILDADEVVANAERTAAAARHLENLTGREIMSIDFGGGLGVPHYDDERHLDLSSLGARVEEVFAPFKKQGTRLMIELGRYLVSECGVYVTRIVELKESRSERYVITDGGINQFVRPVLMKVNHEAAVVNRLDDPPVLATRVTGPLCTPIDVLSKEIEVPESTAIDDLVGVMNAGAYGYSMSPQLFLSHPSPAEVMILDGRVVTIRRRGEYGDLLRDQEPLPGSV
ncbi:MAG: diaminopimelate decarboxylase [Candidatus Eisenbacteria bacterium]|nr:diaminopimelate decarboxylase [Candidatus Eisenbacteria bacterium]